MAKTIVITGAGDGLGRALARRFKADGDTVVLLGRTLSKVRAVADELGGDTLAVQCDVGDPQSVRQAFAVIAERHPRVDVLINNAGIFVPFTLAEVTDDQVKAQLDTNLAGPIYVLARGAAAAAWWRAHHQRHQRIGAHQDADAVAIRRHQDRTGVHVRHVEPRAGDRGGPRDRCPRRPDVRRDQDRYELADRRGGPASTRRTPRSVSIRASARSLITGRSPTLFARWSTCPPISISPPSR